MPPHRAVLVAQAEKGIHPAFIHHSAHSFSDRFTDALVDLLDVAPLLGGASLEAVHEDLAYGTQRLLEDHVLRLAAHFASAPACANSASRAGWGST